LYYGLSTFAGFLIAVMIAINGGLTNLYGVYTATVIIHVAGLVFLCIWTLAKREKKTVMDTRIPIFYYLGGAVGVATTVFNNVSFGYISVSAILALGLLGQSIASIVIDQFGLFRMPKRSFNRKKLVGIAFITLGIVLMILPDAV